MSCVNQNQSAFRARAEATAYIQLTQGKVALVDEADLPRVVAAAKWYAHAPFKGEHHEYWYAYGKIRRRNVALHRFILDAPRGAMVDHINGDGLDNRRCNLRLCSAAGNQQNRRRRRTSWSSRFVGVSRQGRMFRARISGVELGRFHSEEDAARAYDAAARVKFGPLAVPNLPREG